MTSHMLETDIVPLAPLAPEAPPTSTDYLVGLMLDIESAIRSRAASELRVAAADAHLTWVAAVYMAAAKVVEGVEAEVDITVDMADDSGYALDEDVPEPDLYPYGSQSDDYPQCGLGLDPCDLEPDPYISASVQDLPREDIS